MNLWLIGLDDALDESAMQQALADVWPELRPNWIQRQRRVAADLKDPPPPWIEAASALVSLSELRSLRLIGDDFDLRLRCDEARWRAGGVSERELRLAAPWIGEVQAVECVGSSSWLPRDAGHDKEYRLVMYVSQHGLSEWTRQEVTGR